MVPIAQRENNSVQLLSGLPRPRMEGMNYPLASAISGVVRTGSETDRVALRMNACRGEGEF